MASLKTIAKVLEEIQDIFPNWKATERTAAKWAERLTKVDDDILPRALEEFIENSGSSFPPELPVILKIAREIKEKETPKSEWLGLQTPLSMIVDSKTYVPKPPRPEKPQT